MKRLLVLASAGVAAGLMAKRYLAHRRPRPGAPSLLANGSPEVFGTTVVESRADLLGVLTAFDRHQIDTAEWVLEHALDDDTRLLAVRLRDQHVALLAQGDALQARHDPEPAATEAAAEFDAYCADRYERLGDLQDGQASAYLAATAEEHAAMIALLDRSLALLALDAETAAHVDHYRDHLASHLAELDMAG